MPHPRQILGARGEDAAEEFLRQRGYRIVQRNYRCKRGEVDIIALDGRTLVFVEVKTRAEPGFGSPFEAVNKRKQQQIIRAAEFYVTVHKLHEADARFDAVGVWYVGDELHCELIQGAFIIE